MISRSDFPLGSKSQPPFPPPIGKPVKGSLRPVIERDEEKYRKQAILERLTTPDRQILFRVAWVDDAGQTQVNNAYRVQLIDQIQ